MYRINSFAIAVFVIPVRKSNIVFVNPFTQKSALIHVKNNCLINVFWFWKRTNLKNLKFKPKEKDDFFSGDCKRHWMYWINSTTQL